MRWKSVFYEEHGRHADAALLLLNGWRDVPLEERASKLVFEPNIITDAERDDIGLMTGVQLLCLKNAVERGELEAGEARERIIQCVGLYTGSSTIEKISSDVATAEAE